MGQINPVEALLRKLQEDLIFDPSPKNASHFRPHGARLAARPFMGFAQEPLKGRVDKNLDAASSRNLERSRFALRRMGSKKKPLRKKLGACAVSGAGST